VPFHVYMGWGKLGDPPTYRCHKVVAAWVEMEWNRPSRTDHYLINIATEVRRGWVKEPKNVHFDDLKIPFVVTTEQAGQKPPPSKPAEPISDKPLPPVAQTQANMAKQIWLARLNLNPDGTPKEPRK
jgi:hypothetical protein